MYGRSNMIYVLYSVFLTLVAAEAAIQTRCIASDICFSLNIPSITAVTGQGDIYLQISASTTYRWVAIAQGSKMQNANYFVLYTSADVSNVTVSARSDTGVRTPTFNNATQVQVLEGSGVRDGVMVANIKCSNCDSWVNGSMDFTASTTSWIWATKSGPTMNSNDNNIELEQHDAANYGAIKFDASTKGGNNANPYSANPAVCTQTPKLQRMSPAAVSPKRRKPALLLFERDANLTDGTLVCSSISETMDDGVNTRLIMIHGYLACFVFAVLFPCGGILMRLLSFRGMLWIHAALQIFGYVTYIGSAGIGVWLIKHEYIINFKGPHTIIGTVLLGSLFLQAPIGYLHHIYYRKKASRTIWSYLHLWIGRLAIPIGITNGVFGFHIAGEPLLIQVVFGMAAGFMFLVYVGSSTYGERRRKRQIEAATAKAVHELEDALKIGMPPGGAGWNALNGSRHTFTQGLPEQTNSKSSLLDARKSFGSLTYQQQTAWTPMLPIPAPPQTNMTAVTMAHPVAERTNSLHGRSDSMQSSGSNPSLEGSSVYSPQPPQQTWVPAALKVPHRSWSAYPPTQRQQSWPLPKHSAITALQWRKTLPSLPSTTSTIVPAGRPGSYVPAFTGSSAQTTTIPRSQFTGWPPSSVPTVTDENYYAYRFGYGTK